MSHESDQAKTQELLAAIKARLGDAKLLGVCPLSVNLASALGRRGEPRFATISTSTWAQGGPEGAFAIAQAGVRADAYELLRPYDAYANRRNTYPDAEQLIDALKQWLESIDKAYLEKNVYPEVRRTMRRL